MKEGSSCHQGSEPRGLAFKRTKPYKPSWHINSHQFETKLVPSGPKPSQPLPTWLLLSPSFPSSHTELSQHTHWIPAPGPLHVPLALARRSCPRLLTWPPLLPLWIFREYSLDPSRSLLAHFLLYFLSSWLVRCRLPHCTHSSKHSPWYIVGPLHQY